MDLWLKYLLSSAAVITAVSVIWTKLLRPIDKLVTRTREMLPVLESVTEQFKDSPESMKVLREIALQFKTDSGSSLRDVINRLEHFAESNADFEYVKKLRQLDIFDKLNTINDTLTNMNPVDKK